MCPPGQIDWIQRVGMCVCVCVLCTKTPVYTTSWRPIPENGYYFISVVRSVLVFLSYFIWCPHSHLPIFAIWFAFLTKLTVAFSLSNANAENLYVCLCVVRVREREEHGKYGEHYPDRCIHIQKLLKLVQPMVLLLLLLLFLLLLLLALAIYITALRRLFFSPIHLVYELAVCFLLSNVWYGLNKYNKMC